MPDSSEIIKLIQRAQEGSSDAFGELVRSYEKFIFNVACRMFSNAEDASDIAQEALIKAYKNINKFDFNSSFSTWLYRITVNVCIDEMRRRKGKETYSIDAEDEENGLFMQLEDTSEGAEEGVIRKETVSEVRRAIDKLSEEHKMVIILRDLQDLSYEEVAETLGINVGTVKSRLARGRKSLKDIIIKQREQNEHKLRQKNKKGGGAT
jgi:RNA polymerase sigma-70 factor (ECF subfamily)